MNNSKSLMNDKMNIKELYLNYILNHSYLGRNVMLQIILFL